jgi:hypothetical protein
MTLSSHQYRTPVCSCDILSASYNFSIKQADSKKNFIPVRTNKHAKLTCPRVMGMRTELLNK